MLKVPAMSTIRARASTLLATVLLLSACGPRISELRLAPSPPRGAGCPLEFVKLDMMDLSSQTGVWQLVGNVFIGDAGLLDPFSDENKALVRPRACAMGGEGVTIMASASNERLISSASTVNYGILRHRSSAPEPPKAF